MKSISTKILVHLLALQLLSTAQDISDRDPKQGIEQRLIAESQLLAANGLFYSARAKHQDIAAASKKSLLVFHHSAFSVYSLVWIRVADDELKIVSFTPNHKNQWMSLNCKSSSEQGKLVLELIHFSDRIIKPSKGEDIMKIGYEERIEDSAQIECYFANGSEMPRRVDIQCGDDKAGEVEKTFSKYTNQLIDLLHK